MARVVRDVSSGGVIGRTAEAGFEVVLVGRERPERWTLPKGTPVPGETLEQTALREVQEETGLEVRILEPIGDITYWFGVHGVRHHKRVHFYLLEAVGGDVANHDWEYDLAVWMPASEALKRVSHANEANILERAISQLRTRQLESDPLGGHPLLFNYPPS